MKLHGHVQQPTLWGRLMGWIYKYVLGEPSPLVETWSWYTQN